MQLCRCCPCSLCSGKHQGCSGCAQPGSCSALALPWLYVTWSRAGTKCQVPECSQGAAVSLLATLSCVTARGGRRAAGKKQNFLATDLENQFKPPKTGHIFICSSWLQYQKLCSCSLLLTGLGLTWSAMVRPSLSILEPASAIFLAALITSDVFFSGPLPLQNRAEAPS